MLTMNKFVIQYNYELFKSCENKQGDFTEIEVTSIALVRLEFEKPLYVSEKLNPDKNANFSVSRLKECT